MKRFAVLVSGALTCVALANAQQRIITVGTSLTETVYALGAGPAMIATDNSSRDYLPQTKSLPSVGAFRTVNAEGIISLKPTLLLATVDAGPPEALLQIRAAGIETVVVARNYKVDEVRASIRQVAKLLHREKRGEELIADLDRDLEITASRLKTAGARLRVIFCGLAASTPGGTLSGTNTRIAEMIELAGGINAVSQFEGFRPLTEEGVIAAAPDIIVMTERSFERAGGLEGAKRLPGIALTPAGRTGRIIPVSDMYFQGFGPGMGKAVRELATRFYFSLPRDF